MSIWSCLRNKERRPKGDLKRNGVISMARKRSKKTKELEWAGDSLQIDDFTRKAEEENRFLNRKTTSFQ